MLRIRSQFPMLASWARSSTRSGHARFAASSAYPVAEGRRLSPGEGPRALCAHFGLPLVVKPRKSYWRDRLDSWGRVWIVESQAELEKLLPTISEPSRYLVESCFDGDGVGVSVLAEKGEIAHAFQHRRLRQGKGGCSSYRISEPVDPTLLDACAKICRATELTGVCMFEFRHDPRDGSWILIETNARFWGSIGLPLSLGVDFPLYLYDLLVHGRHHAAVPYPAGIRSRNLMLDGLNLATTLRGLRWSQLGAWSAELGDFLAQPIRWLTGRERSDSFVSDDLRPALWECAVLLKSLRQKLERGQAGGVGRRLGDRLRQIAAVNSRDAPA
jgi:predicted ATP-grasp superfamily ATP-dependent carboligase